MWDVTGVNREYERGDRDLDRLARRHRRLWGVIGGVIEGASVTAPVVQGLRQIDPRLADDLVAGRWRDVGPDAVTAR